MLIPTKPARSRTATQIERKRARDKESQKAKRGRQKAYQQRLEAELHEARLEVGQLRLDIRNVEGALRSLHRSHFSEGLVDSVEPSPQPQNYEYLLTKPKRSALSCTILSNPDSDLWAVARSASPHDPWSSESRGSSDPAIGTANASYNSPPVPQGGEAHTVVDQTQHRAEIPPLRCCCLPRKHSTFAECFEQTVFASVMVMAKNVDYPRLIPTSPEVADLLFLRAPTNPVSAVLCKMLRKPNCSNLIVRSAVYIIAYRLLRYRLSPSLETYNDVPVWMRSTETQDSVPHPLYIDFVQFPLLRDAMVLGKVSIDDCREVFDWDFGHCLHVNWPSSQDMLVVDNSFDTILNPQFELHVCRQENWLLKRHFSNKYPHMVHLVNIGP